MTIKDMRIFLMVLLGILGFGGVVLGVALLVATEQQHAAAGAIHEIEALIVILIGATGLVGMAAAVKK